MMAIVHARFKCAWPQSVRSNLHRTCGYIPAIEHLQVYNVDMTGAASIDTKDTKEQILNVAEQLIAERGYAGTTVRTIVSRASVNLAAIHYHFGSKEELFRAVFARIASPIVARQLTMLKALQDDDDEQPPSVEALLTAFLTPPIQLIVQDEQASVARAQFMGRCWTEPEPVKSIAQSEFKESTTAFLDVLQRSLPNQSRRELQWKLDLVIAALIRIKTETGQPHALLKTNNTEDIHHTVKKLVKFLAPGMRSE